MKLKEIRLNCNKKQEDVAKILNISSGAYSHYETERNEPNISMLVKLADYFHVSIDELIGHEVPYTLNRVQFTEKQLEVIESIKDLTDEDCRYLLASIYAIKTAKEEKENLINKFKN